MSFEKLSGGGFYRNMRAQLGESSGYVPFTRREDKERAARIVQRRVRDKKSAAVMHADLARVAREALKSHRKRDDALHGGGGGAFGTDMKNQFLFGSENLAKLQERRVDLSKGVSKKRSDVTSGPHDDGRAYILGSQSLHNRTTEAYERDAKNGPNRRSQFSNIDRNQATMVFGSEDLQRRQVEHTAVKARGRVSSDLHGNAHDNGMVFGSEKLQQITRATHKHKPKGRKRNMELYGDARSEKCAPRRNVGRRSADFHGGDGDENKLFLGSDLSLNIQKLHDAQRNGQGFGRVQQVQRIQEESGALNLGSDHLHRTNQTHKQMFGSKGRLSQASIQRRTQLRDAATLIAGKWRAHKQSGGTLRRRMDDKIADIALAAAQKHAQEDGRELEGVLGKMNRIHEQFMSGGMVPVQAHKQEPETTTRTSSAASNAQTTTAAPSTGRLSVRTSCSTPKMIQPKFTKADLRGVPGHHGKKTFSFNDEEKNGPLAGRFLFGSTSVAENNMMNFDKSHGKINEKPESRGFISGSPELLHRQMQKKDPKSKFTKSKSVASLHPMRKGNYGRAKAKGLHATDDVCFPVGSAALSKMVKSPPTMRGKLYDGPAYISGSQSYNTMSEGLRQERIRPQRKNNVEPLIGDSHERMTGMIDNLGKSKSLEAACVRNRPQWTGDDDKFRFAHGSSDLHRISKETSRSPIKPDGLIHGSTDSTQKVVFNSPTFNKRHDAFEKTKRQGSSYARENILFGWEPFPREISAAEQSRTISAKYLPPKNAKRRAPEPGLVHRNDSKLYGDGGYRGREIDSSNFTSGYFDSGLHDKNFQKDSRLSANAPY
eukprot:g5004.t1